MTSQLAHQEPHQAIHRAIQRLAVLQDPSGCVSAHTPGSPLLTAHYVMVAHLTQQPLAPERVTRLLHTFSTSQLPDGGWAHHDDSRPDATVTTLAYVACRLLDRPPHDPSCQRARTWLRHHGGVLPLPIWGKIWLALLNLCDWAAIPPLLPEPWLQPQWSPLHPKRASCHTRHAFLGLSYLYSVRAQAPLTPTIAALRVELYDRPFHHIDFKKGRFSFAPEALAATPSTLLGATARLAALYERIPRRALRALALSDVLDRIVEHQRQSRFVALSPLTGMLNTLALHHAQHPDFLTSFRALDHWAQRHDKQGEFFAWALSATWDTALAVQAIAAAPSADQATRFLSGANAYLRRAQIQDEVPDRYRYHRDTRRGGYSCAGQHHQWPTTHCTAEVLNAWVHLSQHLAPEQLPAPEMRKAAVTFLLSRHNTDGGWGAFEKKRSHPLVDGLIPLDFLGHTLTEHSTVPSTASCVGGLHNTATRFADLFSTLELARIHDAIGQGVAFLRRAQHQDGHWTEAGTPSALYCTAAAIGALRTAGTPPNDPIIRRAGHWLVSQQLANGGWGAPLRRAPATASHRRHTCPILFTAWALMGLLRAAYDGPGAQAAIDRGVALLIDRQRPDGTWPAEENPTHTLASAADPLPSHRDLFPLWALALYASRPAPAAQ